MRRFAGPLFSACVAAAGCAGAPDPSATETSDYDQEVLARVRDRWDNFSAGTAELQRDLPPLLLAFATDDPARWREAHDTLVRRHAGVEPLGQILPFALERGTQGDRARADLVFLGHAYQLSRGFRAPDPAEWSRAAQGMAALGPRGVDAAAVSLVLKLQPLDVDARTLDCVQRELAALGPGATRVLGAALAKANMVVCERLLPALAALGEPGVAVLVGLLDHPDPETRAIALRALGKVSHPSAAAPLLRFADPGQPWGIRSAALVALGATGDARARAPLLAGLADPDASVCRFAAEGIGRLLSDRDDPEAVEALLKLHDRTGDEYARAHTAARDALRAVTGLRRGGRTDFEAWLAARRAAGKGGS